MFLHVYHYLSVGCSLRGNADKVYRDHKESVVSNHAYVQTHMINLANQNDSGERTETQRLRREEGKFVF